MFAICRLVYLFFYKLSRMPIRFDHKLFSWPRATANSGRATYIFCSRKKSLSRNPQKTSKPNAMFAFCRLVYLFFANSHVCQYASTASFFRGREQPQTQVGQRTFFAVAKNRCPATPKKRQNQMLCLRFADWFICFLQTLTYANTLRPQAFFVAANNRKLKSGNVHFLQSQKIVVPQPLKNAKNRCSATPKKRQKIVVLRLPKK